MQNEYDDNFAIKITNKYVNYLICNLIISHILMKRDEAMLRSSSMDLHSSLVVRFIHFTRLAYQNINIKSYLWTEDAVAC